MSAPAVTPLYGKESHFEVDETADRQTMMDVRNRELTVLEQLHSPFTNVAAIYPNHDQWPDVIASFAIRKQVIN